MKRFVRTYMAPYLGNFFANSCQDRYNLNCVLNAYVKENDRLINAKDFGGGVPLIEDSTTDYLVYICFVIKFIDTWLNFLEKYFVRCVVPIKKIRKKYLNR